MYGVSAASLARQESAFLWPRPSLSPLPPLFPPPLCVYISLGRVGGGRGEEEGREREEGGKKGNKERRGNVFKGKKAGFSSIVCVKWKDETFTVEERDVMSDNTLFLYTFIIINIHIYIYNS